ncbi:MAG: signal recognition particle-docking protein FtsY [Puniceicoccaceae bacterium]
MSRFFKFFKKGFSRTSDRVASVLGVKKIDDATLEELEATLYAADFGIETTESIIEAMQVAFRKNRELQQQEGAVIGKQVLMQHLEGAEGRLDVPESRPVVISLVGVNGSGKTTTAAKLGKLLQEQGQSVLIAACDTFRVAANAQLKTWCERLDLPLITSHQGADAAAVAYDAYAAASSRGVDYLILDTAGRLHTKGNLMDELAKIRRVLQKHDANAPHHSWLVVDGSIGTNSIEQARQFHQYFPLSGLIVTKLDGTSKGGAIVAIFRELDLPVYFVGLGEKPEDLKPFDREDYASAVFGLSGAD